MLYRTTTMIQQAMEEKHLRYKVIEGDDRSVVLAGFSVKNGPNLRAQFISINDRNSVAVRLFGMITKVSDEDRAKIYDVINTVHIKFRYLRFYLDEDGDVDISYDLPDDTPDEGVGPMCVEIFLRIMEVVNKVYPDFMRALWA